MKPKDKSTYMNMEIFQKRDELQPTMKHPEKVPREQLVLEVTSDSENIKEFLGITFSSTSEEPEEFNFSS